MQHSSRLAADGRAHAATTAEVWRTRLDAALNRWRTRSRLDAISVERGPALQALGDAVWRGDTSAEREARQRLVALEQEGKRIEDELAVPGQHLPADAAARRVGVRRRDAAGAGAGPGPDRERVGTRVWRS